MTDPTFELRKQVKTTAIADSALAEVVARLRNSKSVRWKGRRVTQEAVVNAAWLWMASLEPHVIEDAMATFVPYLEAQMTGDDESSAKKTAHATPEGQHGPKEPTSQIISRDRDQGDEAGKVSRPKSKRA